jgi:folate-binding protein YgfZ
VLADSFVLRAGGGVWWILSYGSTGATIKERLEAYVIADDVTIEDRTADWAGRLVVGSEGEAWLRARLGEDLPAVGAWAALEGGWVFRGRRGGVGGCEWWSDRPLPEAAGLTPLTREAVEFLRVEAGVPAIPGDLGPEDLPNEGGLEDEAISYTKGCYLGQEVMARLKAMGRVRRRLLRVRGEASLAVPPPAPLFQDGKKVGELRSLAAGPAGGSVGLAMCSLLALAPGRPLSLAPDGPGALELR